MWSFEKRWAIAVLEGFAPEEGPGLAPRAGEVDYLGAFDGMRRTASRPAALVLRLAVWLAALAPWWMRLRPRTLGSLPRPERAEVLAQLLVHRVVAVRELALLLKLAACFGLLGVASVRARSAFDRRESPGAIRYDDVSESGERPVLRGQASHGRAEPTEEVA